VSAEPAAAEKTAVWQIKYDASSVRVPTAKRLRDLAALARELHLARASSGVSPTRRGPSWRSTVRLRLRCVQQGRVLPPTPRAAWP
jgi:hypothetical protein